MDQSEIKRRSIRFYSESGEDCFVWNLLQFKTDGVFIDVGAFDGKYLSNSFSFAENGWIGVCVEPLEQYAALCRQNQPHSICVNAACVSSDEIERVQFSCEPLGIYSRLSVKEGDVDRLQAAYQKYDGEIQGFQNVDVPAVTVRSLVQTHLRDKVIDFLSVDVEGGEIEVLKGSDIGALMPRIICAEANDEESKIALDAFLSPYGYIYMRSMGNNHFYSAESALIEREKELEIRCAIERQTHPMGAQYTFPGILSGKIIDEVSHRTIYSMHARLRGELLKNHLSVQVFADWLDKPSDENFFDLFDAARSSIASGGAELLRLRDRVESLERTLRMNRFRVQRAEQNALLDAVESRAQWSIPRFYPGKLRAVEEPRSALEIRRLLHEQSVRPALTGHAAPVLVQPKDALLCVAGFPRSANSALVGQLKRLNPVRLQGNAIAHHAYGLVQIKLSIRLGLPVFIPLRLPAECIASRHLHDNVPLKQGLKEWLEFHEQLLPLLKLIYLVKSESIVEHGEAIARRILGMIDVPVEMDPARQDGLPAGQLDGTAAAKIVGDLPKRSFNKATALYEMMLSSGRFLDVNAEQ